MDIYDAVESRRAVRGFTDLPVPREALERVLTAASRTPSGGNVQPWNSYVLTGEALAELKRRTTARLAAGDRGDEPEFAIYPENLKSPYRERRFAAGEQRYAALGIRRHDTGARERHVAGNWDCFGAPAALLCYIDRDMEPAQWADVGMYLQTVMLLLRGEGLHSCPQKAWSVYHRTVAEMVAAPAELVLFCGMSIGFEDPREPRPRIDRAPLSETVTFLDRATGAASR
ncbi:MAG TPA: nitroreductase [Candidatus Dormibacteraeota bacterium]|jgi:nitroreductase|nr:nitroreductase [Candidatus Dormibacteraeota bacterium]